VVKQDEKLTKDEYLVMEGRKKKKKRYTLYANHPFSNILHKIHFPQRRETISAFSKLVSVSVVCICVLT